MMAKREAKASAQNETTIVAEAAEMEPTATELPMSSTEEK
jgi:hypothetical protein